jgi:putative hemolysin
MSKIKRANSWILISITILVLIGVFFLISEIYKPNNSQIANPASVYCVENNGSLEIRESENGQYGVCIKDGKECEEWKYFRGECELSANSNVCSVNEDCVPDSCCHATSCTTKNNAPNCSQTMCTMECRSGTLDCGYGSCECTNNKCEAVLK